MDSLKPIRPQLPGALRMAGCFLFALAGAVLLAGIAMAQASRPGEYEVKAAFLINFAKFVEWPDSSFDGPQGPIVFGVIGADHQLAFNLRRLSAGQKVQGRDVVIREGPVGDDMRRCHVLFVSPSERHRATQILASLQDASVLTVSDIDGFAEEGGAMQFVTQDNRVHFIVNLDAATQSKLRVSAKLLALAHLVNHNEAAK
jgi:YfiR/HmsC-like